MTTDNLETASAPPEGRWTFDGNVTEAFDDMLERSIPNYEDMRRFVTDAACYFATHSALKAPHIVDLGASRGSSLAPIVDRLGAKARFTAVEMSDPMLEALRERFKGYRDARVLEVKSWDLRDGYPHGSGIASVILSVLTLQFVPIEYRQRLLGDIFRQLAVGGAFLLVEKVMGGTAEADDLMRVLYHDLKAENGYGQDAIERKAASLEGVLVPLTARFNEELLRSAGFADPEQVWAWGPFRGWLAVKR